MDDLKNKKKPKQQQKSFEDLVAKTEQKYGDRFPQIGLAIVNSLQLEDVGCISWTLLSLHFVLFLTLLKPFVNWFMSET